MRGENEIFIPGRLYERLRTIYTSKLTVISAPSGSGKTTLVREFIARSRPSDFSCKNIRGKTADECFMQLSRLVIGRAEHIPLTDSELVRLKASFAAAISPEKPTLLIFDAPGAADMLLSCLRCAELIKHYCPYSVLILTDREYIGSKYIIRDYEIEYISGSELNFTEDEIAEYFARCGVADINSAEVYALTQGRIQHTRLSMLAAKAKVNHLQSTVDLFYDGIIKTLTAEQICSLMIAVSFDKLSVRFCEEVSQSANIAAELDPACFEIDEIINNIKYFNRLTGAINVNRHTLEVRFSLTVRRAVKRLFDDLPFAKRRDWRVCIANEYLRQGENFFAFCELFLAEEWEQAAAVQIKKGISLDILLAAKDILHRFIISCPLSCKPIIPRLLSLTSLLMLTTLKDEVRGKFAEIIAYINASPDYTEQQRRHILSYAYLMRTYEYFYDLSTMGNTIKIAYDLYSKELDHGELFHSWTMYSPSVFCIIHRNNMPIKVEREQFTRYMKMYVEMAGHGYYVADLFNAECVLFEGNPAAAKKMFERIIYETQNTSVYLGASFMCAVCCICLGLYEQYTKHLRNIIGITHRSLGSEEGKMGLLCFALLSWICGGSTADMWHITSIDANRINDNRYTEPFVFVIYCSLLMRIEKYEKLLEYVVGFLEAAESVKNVYLTECYTLYSAEAHRRLGNKELSSRMLSRVLNSYQKNGTVLFQALFSAKYPELFEQTELLTAEEARCAADIAARGKIYRKGIHAIRSYEMSISGGADLTEIRKIALCRCADDACAKNKLNLTDKAYRIAVLAAMDISNAEIAEIYSITEDSVKSSLKRTYAKLGIRSRSQLKTIIKPKQ